MPHLGGANLHRVNLNGAYLSWANLKGTNLSKATLYQVDLGGADLSRANLSGANLFVAKFNGANLNQTDFSGAIMSWTIVGDVDLSVAKGLDTVIHATYSTIGIDTIYRSGGNIPEVFLKGAGIDDTFITYIRSLVGKPIEYYSCFISYSSKDEAFAGRLYADLQTPCRVLCTEEALKRRAFERILQA